MISALRQAVGATLGALFGVLVGFIVIAIWRPNLAHLDVVGVLEGVMAAVFTVVVTALAIVAALMLSGAWQNTETRARNLERDLRTKQKEVALDAIREDRLARQPKPWLLGVLGVIGFVLGLLYAKYVLQSLQLDVYNEMKDDYLRRKGGAEQG